MSDLKPCPCCGSEAVIFEQYKKDGCRIKCKNCALKREQRTLCYSMEWLESKIKENWNNRPIDKEIAQLEADYKKEFNDAEDLRCVIEDLKADKAELLEALSVTNSALSSLTDDSIDISNRVKSIAMDALVTIDDLTNDKYKDLLQKHKG